MKCLSRIFVFGLTTYALSWLQVTGARSEGLWAVARGTAAFAGSCYVGTPPFPNPFAVQYPQILASNLESRKVACQKAKDLKTTELSDLNKCFGYSSASITDCIAEDVDLIR
jgi:hypothetical protein